MADEFTIELVGAGYLKREMSKFPSRIKQRAIKTGYRKAAQKYRTFLRRAAPRRSGTLRKDIGYKKVGNSYRVGVMNRFYYNLLEYRYGDKGEYNPWFEDASEQFAGPVLDLMVAEMEKALYYEAGKLYRRTLERKR